MTDGRPDVVCIALFDVKHRIIIKDVKEGSVSSRCFQALLLLVVVGFAA